MERKRSRAPWLWGVAIVAVVVVVGFAASFLGLFDMWRPVPVERILLNAGDVSPTEATAELCTEEGPLCVEGWRTDVGDYIRFEHAGEAEEWMAILGDDGRQWKTIVLDMHDYDLTFDQRRLAVEILYANHDWY